MNDLNDEKHVLSLLVDNTPGVLSSVVGLFSGRGFNITSLCVAETLDPKTSRITLVTSGDASVVEQIKKQLNKLIGVVKVYDFTGAGIVSRDMALVKVRARSGQRAEIFRNVDIFRGKVVDVGPDDYILEVTGNEAKVDAFIDLLKHIGIKEIARTGTIALARDK
ncbi:MAG TPA: acetolactate synthase small subunit [Desulfobacteraceae bacterium]|jgi:acetolactate synthase I/III small subunit|nr:acetolactate synthase small subunit [Desulfobacteraceae bacterium]